MCCTSLSEDATTTTQADAPFGAHAFGTIMFCFICCERCSFRVPRGTRGTLVCGFQLIGVFGELKCRYVRRKKQKGKPHHFKAGNLNNVRQFQHLSALRIHQLLFILPTKRSMSAQTRLCFNSAVRSTDCRSCVSSETMSSSQVLFNVHPCEEYPEWTPNGDLIMVSLRCRLLKLCDHLYSNGTRPAGAGCRYADEARLLAERGALLFRV